VKKKKEGKGNGKQGEKKNNYGFNPGRRDVSKVEKEGMGPIWGFVLFRRRARILTQKKPKPRAIGKGEKPT